MRVRCKQRITTTGLDIYFQKVKPGKGVNRDNVEELDNYNNKLVRDRFRNKTKRLMANINRTVQVSERTELITKLREYVKKVMEYDWYYDKLTPELTNEELKEKIEQLTKIVYAKNDVYFRKVNFVYAFFSPYLEDECCIVTKDMVRELITNCDKVLEAARQSGVLNDNYEFIIPEKEFFYQYKEGENMFNITNERRAEEELRIQKLKDRLSGDWVETAKDYLPTQCGFFFGSTDYDVYYLRDVIDCKKQFEKLLSNWKDEEVVYNIMSW